MQIDDDIVDINLVHEFRQELEDSFELKSYLFDNPSADQQYVGEFYDAPDHRNYQINSIYKNTTSKTAYINTKVGWMPLVRDGERGPQGATGRDGNSYRGSGTGVKEVLDLIAQELANWPGTSGSGVPATSGVFVDPVTGYIQPIYFQNFPNLITDRGIESLDPYVNDPSPVVVSITHQPIDISYKAPITTLIVPSSSASYINLMVTNRTTTSFDVVLNQSPTVSGYSINWTI